MQLLTMDLDTFSQASFLGFAALTAYILTLLPTNLRIVFPLTKKTGFPQWLLKYRRVIGLLSFFLGNCSPQQCCGIANDVSDRRAIKL